MLTSTQAFLDPLEHWVRAIRSGDFDGARRSAEHLARAGELLAIHPDFRRCFSQRCGDVDPLQALDSMSQFLLCATVGRARVAQRQDPPS